ncbi:MAG: Clp protease N-terminal domain-containing protein [Streptosporangiaceae bacterium]
MFERFTDRARRTVVLAQEEARGLNHNYIGTEHILLGLIREGDGVAARVLDRFGVTPAGTREEVIDRVGTGNQEPPKKIPFTPRAKKVLELALREALKLSHNYIGTEHILLGLIQEGDGVGAQILAEHAANFTVVREAVIEVLHGYQAPPGRRWLRRRNEPLLAAGPEGPGAPGESEGMPTTPAADASLAEAARLAGSQPVGSHHLLLAALTDPESAAAQTLTALGVNLDQAREALRNAEVAGTSDEQLEERGRRHMVIRVTSESLAIEATDPAIVALARAAIEALGGQAQEAGVIRGDQPGSAGLGQVWLALRDSLEEIRERAAGGPGDSGDEESGPEKGRPAA